MRPVISDEEDEKMLQQVSIFAENKRGTMEHVTRVLKEQDINILGSVTNDSAEYGIIRMVVSDPDAAIRTLTENGFVCKPTDVLGIEVQDEVGNLNRLLAALMESNINVDYLYLSFNRDSGRPVMVLHTADIFEVEDCLRGKGFVSL